MICNYVYMSPTASFYKSYGVYGACLAIIQKTNRPQCYALVLLITLMVSLFHLIALCHVNEPACTDYVPNNGSEWNAAIIKIISYTCVWHVKVSTIKKEGAMSKITSLTHSFTPTGKSMHLDLVKKQEQDHFIKVLHYNSLKSVLKQKSIKAT